MFEIRKSRTVAQGPRALVREREEYFRLVDQGLSSQEACRRVGINYRTGKRWPNGRNASGKAKASPAVLEPLAEPGPSRYLRVADRIHIADRLREKASICTIAAELGRSPSTISREIERNSHPDSGAYRPHAAQARADDRRPRPKPGKIEQDPELRSFIQDHLDRRWSPEQICQALRDTFPGRPEMHVVHETVYQALYVQARGGLRREVAAALRTGRALRKPHRRTDSRQSRFASPMVMISERQPSACINCSRPRQNQPRVATTLETAPLAGPFRACPLRLCAFRVRSARPGAHARPRRGQVPTGPSFPSRPPGHACRCGEPPGAGQAAAHRWTVGRWGAGHRRRAGSVPVDPVPVRRAGFRSAVARPWLRRGRRRPWPRRRPRTRRPEDGVGARRSGHPPRTVFPPVVLPAVPTAARFTRATEEEPCDPQHQHHQCDPPEDVHGKTDAAQDQGEKQHQQQGTHDVSHLLGAACAPERGSHAPPPCLRLGRMRGRAAGHAPKVRSP